MVPHCGHSTNNLTLQAICLRAADHSGLDPSPLEGFVCAFSGRDELTTIWVDTPNNTVLK